MAAVQAFEQGPTPTPWDKPDTCKEMETAVPVDPSQAWENARKALEKVQTTNSKAAAGADQQAPAGYGTGFGYGFWPGQHQQQGCMYPGYMGYNGYSAQGPGGSGYGFYPHFNMYSSGYYASSAHMQYPQSGPAGGGNNSAPAGPPLPSGHAPPPPPPGEQAPPPSEEEGGASEAPSSGGGAPPQVQQQQQQQLPPGFGQQGPATGFGPGGYGSGFCPPGPGYGFYYGYNGMGPNGEVPGPRGPMQFNTGMQGKQAPGAGGVRFSLPKRGKFGGRGGGSRANAFQQQRAAQGQRSAADATQRLEDCMANLTPHSGDMPESLKRYAMRAFSKCKSELDRDQVEIVLKGKLTKMFHDGGLWAIDWDKEQLPSIHSERLQQEQLKVVATAAGVATPQDSSGSSGSSKVGSGLLPGLGSSGSPPSKLLSPPKAGGGGLGRRLGGMTGRLGQALQSSAGGLSSRLSSSAQLGGGGGGESPPGYIPLKSSSSSNRRGVSDWGRGSSRRSPRSRSRSRSRSWSPRSRSPTASHSTPRDRRKKRRSSSLESSSSLETPRSSKKVLNSSVSSYTHGNSNSTGGKSKKSGQANRKANKKQKKHQQHQMVQFQVEEDMATSEKLQKRAARFQSEISAGKKKRPFSLVLSINAGPTLGPPSSSVNGDGDTELDWESFPIVGTCQDLEKQYLRLTSAPDPSTIRPVAVLRESLDMVKEQWVQKQDYHYACDQLKSIRQDLTVQCVRDTFTVQVYETHARIALEKGDHEEFNQCQTQLKTLYQEVQCGNPLEFLGYRVLYNVFARNTLELKTILAHLSTPEKSDEVVKHALAVCHAWSLGNYARFFKLYERPPKMSGYLMDWFVVRERRNALKAMVKA